MTSLPIVSDFAVAPPTRRNPSCVDELKIELTDACQARCSFCHQRGEHPDRIGHLAPETARDWVDWAASQGIGTVRFTGGEPTLHPGLLALCGHAKVRGLETIVNSNGLYGYSMVEAMVGLVDSLKISVPTLDAAACDALTGVQGSLRRKLETVVHALELGLSVDLLTAMVPENVGMVSSFVRLQQDLAGVRWVPLRLESSPDSPRPVEREWLQRLAEELDRAMAANPGRVSKLHLATPFCAVHPIELGARVFSGRAVDCGPFASLTVTMAGTLAACYSCRRPVPRHARLADVHEEPEFVRLTSVDELPGACRDCKWVEQCMGGCASFHSTVEHEAGGRVDYLVVLDGAKR